MKQKPGTTNPADLTASGTATSRKSWRGRSARAHRRLATSIRAPPTARRSDLWCAFRARNTSPTEASWTSTVEWFTTPTCGTTVAAATSRLVVGITWFGMSRTVTVLASRPTSRREMAPTLILSTQVHAAWSLLRRLLGLVARL